MEKSDRAFVFAATIVVVFILWGMSLLKCTYCWSFNLSKTRVIERVDGVESEVKWCHHHWNFRHDYPNVDNGEGVSNKYTVIRKLKNE